MVTRMKLLAAILVLALAACAAGPQAACRPEKLAELPVRLFGGVPVIDVLVNGRPAALVIDTGSDSTVLTRTAARRLGLAEAAERQQLTGAGGGAEVGVARLDTLALGAEVVAGVRVLLSDAPAPPLDGVLGIDRLVAYELELDAPNRRMALWKARPCATAQPTWPPPTTQLGVQQQGASGHLFVPAELNGQPVRAMLDTGASRTTVSLQAAGEAGFRGARLAALPTGRGQAMNAGGILVRAAPFRSLRVGTDGLDAPVLAVVDLPAGAGDMLLGSDYLASRRVWFSFILGRVFVAASP